jgi:hypothetical protein
MLTAWAMANKNAQSCLTSEGLGVDTSMLTLLASPLLSLTSPDLLLVAGKASYTVFTALFAVSTAAEVIDASRTGLTRFDISVASADSAALRGMVCRRR